MCSLVQVELCVYCPVAGDELTLSVLCNLTLQVNLFSGRKSIGYHSLHGSTMECSLAFSVTGVTGLIANAR